MKQELGSRLFAYLTLAVMLIAAIYVTQAEVPIGAQTVTEGYESTINLSNYPAASVEAYAGNISNLTIFGRSQTKHWQGYYGEITGVIVLDDAFNWTLYDWSNSEPKGEIYAVVNDTIDWTTAQCFNYSGVEAGGNNNTDYWETFYNMTYNDVDGIDETFTATNHPTFDVGDVTVVGCPTTYTFVTDLAQGDKYAEVLLQDDLGAIIFSTIIENDDVANNTDPIGYDNRTHDFQMLVAEDGTSRTGGGTGNRNQDTTTYYFYIDIQ